MFVVNINSTAVFEHFEDLKVFIILNILKEKSLASWALFVLRFFKQQCVNSHDK